MLGSAAKIQKLFEEYRRAGIKGKALQSIHAPIGISIQSKTPEEIAISIAAQLIEIRNKVSK